MASGAVSVRPVTGLVEALQPIGVHVQQSAGLGPLVAAREPLTRRPAPLRAPVAMEDLPDRRAAIADQAGQPGRPVVGPLPGLEDSLLLIVGQPPRTRP